jgi:hypothetical protein
METALVVLLVLFLLGGGGWGYRRYRASAIKMAKCLYVGRTDG